MQYKELLNAEKYVKSDLPEYIFTADLVDKFSEQMFLDIFKQDYFFIALILSITDITEFFDKLGFKQIERLHYEHDSGFVLSISPYYSDRHKRGYYVSNLNYPNRNKQMLFELEHMYKIHVNYKSQHEKYSSGSYPIDFGYVVSLDEKTYNIKSIHHSSDIFNLNHVELHTLNSLKTFANKLDYNIHRIEEEPLSSITIDDNEFINVSLFDVVYMLTDEMDRVRSFSLSDIITNCGFSLDRMIGQNVEKFMNIENVFNEDELKMIEMVYI